MLLLPLKKSAFCSAPSPPKTGGSVWGESGMKPRVWDTHLVASSIFFRECRSLGSVCCRFKYSETALAGNSVSQMYPKSLAKWTASPEKTAAEFNNQHRVPNRPRAGDTPWSTLVIYRRGQLFRGKSKGETDALSKNDFQAIIKIDKTNFAPAALSRLSRISLLVKSF